MDTTNAAVEGLNNLAALVPVLENLGKRHVAYGVLPVHYEVVGQALLNTLEIGLSPSGNWTPQVKEAWGKVDA